MTLPPHSRDWPPEAIDDLIESVAVKAEQRREDPKAPSPETWRLAEMGVRQRWEERR
jgi:hypothetical protein